MHYVKKIIVSLFIIKSFIIYVETLDIMQQYNPDTVLNSKVINCWNKWPSTFYSNEALNWIKFMYTWSQKNFIKKKKPFGHYVYTFFSHLNKVGRVRRMTAISEAEKLQIRWIERKEFPGENVSFLGRFVVLLGLRIVISKENWTQNICAFFLFARFSCFAAMTDGLWNFACRFMESNINLRE